LDSSIIILGFANLLADGFTMFIGAYLSTRTEKDQYEKHRLITGKNVEGIHETEKQHIRQIYSEKGFKGELLNQVVEVITGEKERWVDVKMKEGLKMNRQ
jgi:VIT1/CCC1 family predicted Fe2+/Mn2+ transporter